MLPGAVNTTSCTPLTLCRLKMPPALAVTAVRLNTSPARPEATVPITVVWPCSTVPGATAVIFGPASSCTEAVAVAVTSLCWSTMP